MTDITGIGVLRNHIGFCDGLCKMHSSQCFSQSEMLSASKSFCAFELADLSVVGGVFMGMHAV